MEKAVTYPTQIAQLEGTDPDKIRQMLKKLWDASATADAQASGIRVRHSCVLNLVIVLPDSRSEQECVDCAECVGCAESAFTIILAADESLAPGESRTKVMSPCMVGGEQSQSCCERVILRFAPGLLDDMAQTVEGLYVEDLRRFIWWRRELDETNRLYRRLAMTADRVIVDTKFSRNGSAGLRAITRSFTDAEHPTLTDINWGRITRWRELTAQIFDTPERHGLPQGIHGVEIVAAVPHESLSPVAPLLYVGWLAAALNWQTQHATRVPDGLEATFVTPAGKELQAKLKLLPEHDAGGRILHVLLQLGDAEAHEASIDRDWRGSSAKVCMRIGQDELVCKMVAFPRLDPVRLLMDELNYVERDYGYENALHIAAELLEHLEQ